MQNNTTQMRRMNADLLRQVLRQNPGSTKIQLAEKSGLSYPTCNTIMNAFTASGEAIAQPKSACDAGRPSVQYTYNGNFGSLLCLSLSREGDVTTLCLTAYNLLGAELLAQRETWHQLQVQHLKDIILEALPLLPPAQCICVGIPGVVPDGRSITLCDIPALANCRLAEELEGTFSIPVVLENDMNLTGLGFATWQNLPDNAPAAAVAFPSQNFSGAGIVVGGRILRGFSNFAGEISFLPFGYQRGTSHEQLELGEAFLPLMCNTLLALICVLNPRTVLLTGSLLQNRMLPEIQQFCAAALPPEHLPEMILQPDFEPFYRQGLLALAQEITAYPLKIVKLQV